MMPSDPSTYCPTCGLFWYVHGCKPGKCATTTGLTSPLAMSTFPPSSLPTTPAGRLEFVTYLLTPQPIIDENGEPTGEYTEPMITKADAKRLLGDMDAAPPTREETPR